MTAEDDTEASAHYARAQSHPAAERFPFELARIRLAHGIAVRRLHGAAAARLPLTQAAKTFDRLGAPAWAARAHAELRAAGVAPHTPAPASVPLTWQERRVAELAAGGLTNKEIGEQMRLSPAPSAPTSTVPSPSSASPPAPPSATPSPASPNRPRRPEQPSPRPLRPGSGRLRSARTGAEGPQFVGIAAQRRVGQLAEHGRHRAGPEERTVDLNPPAAAKAVSTRGFMPSSQALAAAGRAPGWSRPAQSRRKAACFAAVAVTWQVR